MNLLQFKIGVAKFLGIVKTEDIPSMEEKRALIEKLRIGYNPEVFLETGTFWGDTIEFFKHKFAQLYSIELSEDLYERACKRFASDSHVTILNGDSGELFIRLLPTINNKILFWLDGHYSSEFFVGNEYIKTAKGDSNTPILKELDAIIKYTSGVQVVLIDDARLFIGKEDYPSLTQLKDFLQRSGRKFDFRVDTDIIVIILS